MTSIKFILKNTPLADGSYRVLMRLIKDQKKKIISLDLKCSEKDFEHGKFKRRHPGYKKRNKLLDSYGDRINNIIDEFELRGLTYSLSDIERAFKSKKADNLTIYPLFDQKMKSPLIVSKTVTAYKNTKNSLLKFHPEELPVKKIDTQFLEQYSAHLRKRGSNDGGIKFFMTHLKAVWNMAEKAGIVSKESNPFQNFKLSKFRGKPIKKALNRDEMKALLTVDLEDRPDLKDSHNYALFSFYCRGINFVDLMLLRKGNVDENILTYTRSKTKKQYVIELLEPAMKIIVEYKNNKAPYLFPILLKSNNTPQQFENRRHKMLRKYNSDLKKIAEKAGIKKSISSYTLRHTYATILKNKGVSTEVISEAMGHSNPRVTQSYLDDFGNDLINNEHRKLLDL